MINREITTSILNQKAKERNHKSVVKAPQDVRVEIFRETMSDLEEYLDVGNLRKLKQHSLSVIRDDVLETLDGVRGLRSQPLPSNVKSIDGTLDGLRKAKIDIQVSMGMFDSSGELDEKKSKSFFNHLDTARKHIENAIKQFTK